MGKTFELNKAPTMRLWHNNEASLRRYDSKITMPLGDTAVSLYLELVYYLLMNLCGINNSAFTDILYSHQLF